MHHGSTVDWMELLHRAARAPFKASAQEGSGLPGGDWVAADLEEHGRRRTATALEEPRSPGHPNPLGAPQLAAH